MWLGYLTNEIINPEKFPIVNCSPPAVVLLPYLGQFAGNHDSGSPMKVYKPVATTKHPKYFAPCEVAVSRIVYPVKDTEHAIIMGNARCWYLSEIYAVRRYTNAPRQ